jgi:type II secretory pathway pseudopilin PulG
MRRVLSSKQAQLQRKAFTLLQILAVMGIIAVLATVLLPVTTRSRMASRRAVCDVHLKAIALALDAFHQEKGHYPQSLEELRSNKYLQDPNAFRCPSDPRPPAEASYDDYYVVRAPRDDNDSPIVLCPFHEENGFGAQAYKGRYTTQFAAKPARIVSARNATVQRPGKEPIAAASGMGLRGGDRITVGASSAALRGVLSGNGLLGSLGNRLLDSGETIIEFADGSRATLRGGSDITVLQSFVMGHESAPLYTVVKQTAGQVLYRVNHGSRFDVGTPTATAGARGTEFTVTIAADGSTELYVSSGKVLFTTLNNSIVAPVGRLVNGLLDGLISIF